MTILVLTPSYKHNTHKCWIHFILYEETTKFQKQILSHVVCVWSWCNSMCQTAGEKTLISFGIKTEAYNINSVFYSRKH